MTYTVCVDTYSLEAGDVGKYVTPIYRSQHRSLKAAGRRLATQINQRGTAYARRFYVTDESGNVWTRCAILEECGR